jgi:hypothetical protein
VNITGVQNYSKETVGLRQPGLIKDQQFRLVYVYPMLVADILNQQKLKKTFRNFLASSFLREIFVSNSLNIIRMAANIPAADQVQTNVAQLIGNAVLSGGTTTYPTTTPVITSRYSDANSYQLQNRVEKKTNQIMNYLLSDPRTKKLMPEVEIITLNNLIDVPVIVGTKDYDIPTYPLIYVLLIAVATNTRLDSFSNVEKVIRSLKNANEKDWAALIKTLTTVRTDERGALTNFLNNFISEYYPNAKNTTQLGRFRRYLANKIGLTSKEDKEVEERNLAPQPDFDRVESKSFYNILKLVKNSLDDLSLKFKFVLNPDLLRNQIGLDINNNSMQSTVVKLSSNQQQIFATMYDKFMELLYLPGSLFLSSVFNTLYPVNNPELGLPVQRLNFLEIKEKHIDHGLGTKIQRLIFDTIVGEIRNNLGQYSPAEAKEKKDLLINMCKSTSNVDTYFTESLKRFTDNSSGGDRYLISSINFTEYQLDGFMTEIHKFASSLLSQNKRFENIFSQLVKNGAAILKMVRSQIYESIEDFMSAIYDTPNYNSAMTYRFNVDPNEVRRGYIPQMSDTLFVIIYFFFLYRLQSALCEYVQILDVEVEAKVNDVFDFPNYTMVITTDILKAVYTAYLANNLKDLLSGDIREISNMQESNIKGIIKYLCNRLAIPAIIVYDEKKKEIYYKFMFMSSAEKISTTSLDSFIKSNRNINS